MATGKHQRFEICGSVFICTIDQPSVDMLIRPELFTLRNISEDASAAMPVRGPQFLGAFAEF